MAERLSGFPFGMILLRHDLLLRNMFRQLIIINLILADIPIINQIGDICRVAPISMGIEATVELAASPALKAPKQHYRTV